MSAVLVIDNYDSFTYNLVHLLEGVGAKVVVVRNDKLDSISIDDYENILISPGPGVPSDIPQVRDFFLKHFQSKNILGVCLGHQLIAECFEEKIELSEQVFHGISTQVEVDYKSKLFHDLPNSFSVGRYHSWIVNEITNPDLLETASSEDGVVMAFQHKSYAVFGIQFHPESILSEYGREIISNWLK